MKRALILLWLGAFGGGLYLLIEILWRGYTHPAMFFVGGACFVLNGLMNEFRFSWSTPLLLQGLIAAVVVLAVEFVAGVILNLWLRLDVWDYSTLPWNLAGQICLYYAGAWYGLSIVGVVLDDYLRYWFFEEEKPRYRII
jgi:uncharacterized membrane protein